MLKTAMVAAKKAGKIVMQDFKKEINIYKKDKFDIVTSTDVETEKLITSIIKKNFPNHNIYCEESGLQKNKSSEYTWIIDSLDGTINFSRKILPFSVSIALIKKEAPYLGVIFDPFRNELFYAQKDKGAFLNGAEIKVSRTKKLERALIISDLTKKRSFQSSFFKIMKKFSNKVLGERVWNSSAIDLAYIACGRFDIYLKNITKILDFSAGAIIVTEAGGIVTDFDRNPVSAQTRNIVAANKFLHKNCVDLINEDQIW